MLADVDAAFARSAPRTGIGKLPQRVRAAMAALPRERFVPPATARQAYDDAAVSIDCGQTISQPFVVALMTTLLDLGPDDSVLEIGTGSGYQTAVLSPLCQHVVSLERWPQLASDARATLHAQGCTDVEVHCADGRLGWPDHAPYDGVIVTCACEHIEQAWIDQLAPGGRLVVPVGPRGDQRLLLVTRTERGATTTRSVLPVRFVPLLSGVAPSR